MAKIEFKKDIKIVADDLYYTEIDGKYIEDSGSCNEETAKQRYEKIVEIVRSTGYVGNTKVTLLTTEI